MFHLGYWVSTNPNGTFGKRVFTTRLFLLPKLGAIKAIPLGVLQMAILRVAIAITSLSMPI
jgi:hypothetical protein